MMVGKDNTTTESTDHTETDCREFIAALDLIRELVDFCYPTGHYRYKQRAIEAMKRSHEMLKKHGM